MQKINVVGRSVGGSDIFGKSRSASWRSEVRKHAYVKKQNEIHYQLIIYDKVNSTQYRVPCV